MTRKYILLFLVLTVSLYFLLSGFLGPKGYFANQALEARYEEMEERARVLEERNRDFERQMNQAESIEELRDNAKRLGLSMEGDVVYIIEDTEGGEEQVEVPAGTVLSSTDTYTGFVGIPTWLQWLLSVALALMITVLFALPDIKKLKTNRNKAAVAPGPKKDYAAEISKYTVPERSGPSNVIDKDNPAAIAAAATILRKNGSVILPCDTIYGICTEMSLIGASKLATIKNRPQEKQFIALATLDQVHAMVHDVPEALERAWPAPLTAVLKMKSGENQAIRVPDDLFLQTLLDEIGVPLYSTSVNISGEPAMGDFTAIADRFASSVELLVKGEEHQGTVASTIVDYTKPQRGCPFTVLRKGAFDPADLLD